MKTAVFSDVHGNLPALERFVEATQGVVDSYLCLGDVVNYGPWNDECLEIVRALPGIVLLEGNHERLFLGTEDLSHELPLVQAFCRHSMNCFSRPDWITGLPRVWHVGVFQCSHTIHEMRIYPDTVVDIACNHLIGHSHHQFKIERSGWVLANPGSVGQNRKWIDTVDYLVLDTTSQEVTMHSLSYNLDLFLCERGCGLGVGGG